MNIDERKAVIATIDCLLHLYEQQTQELLELMEKEHIEQDFFEDLYEIIYEFLYDEKLLLARTLKFLSVKQAKNTQEIK